ncbi:MAG: thioredoxin-dependent thiol peroxidase [Cytophagaceae bacterium]|jgi:peroxiredoxin Q/BCP|nr:thioredoxin-dependent thiol peroxidase [Cytophagaceae bacterium]
MKLKIGDKAPDIVSKDLQGNEVSLASFKGKKIVLYFYPKDDTPTCTKQACNLRDNHQQLLAAGYMVIGISTDTSKSHEKFIKKYQLPFPLIADPTKEINEAYGVWAEKSMYGKTYMGTLRTTFVINEEGYIENIIEKVDSANHSQQILSV